MPTVTQRRNTVERWGAQNTSPSGVVSENPQYFGVDNSQVTTSFRTSMPEDADYPPALEISDILEYNKRGLNPSDTGHPFSSVKTEHGSTAGTFTGKSNSGYVTVKRPLTFAFVDGVLPYPKLTPWSVEEQNRSGNRAVKATLPTIPQAGVGQFIGELKDGLPKILGHPTLMALNKLDRKSAASYLGDEFLNFQFGLVPFVQDLDKMFKAVVSAPDIIKQYKRDSGRLVRRKLSFPPTTEIIGSPITGQTSLATWGTADVINGLYDYNTTQTRQTSVWFSGAYRYHLPQGDDLLSKAEYYASLAQKLLGIRMSPDVLWELTPWSWLADWVSDVGNNLTVGTAFAMDNVAMEYGYLMRKQIARSVLSSTRVPDGYPKGYVGPGQIHEMYSITSKERVKASPFGFGIPSTQFSTDQWAILSALGSTRAGKKR